MMAMGRKPEARRKFIAAIRRDPWFGKAWLRLAQSLT
jgi:hypothetical protein